MNIGLTAESLSISAAHLTQLVNLELVLSIKTKRYHWNIQGPHFQPLHDFLDEQYAQLIELTDSAAERLRMLNLNAPGNPAELGQLLCGNMDTREEDVLLQQLLEDHEWVIRLIRDGIEACTTAGDAGTSDLLTGHLREHEKMAWMLRSFNP